MSRPVAARLARVWERIAGYFVPEAIARDRDASNRARMFLISHAIGPVLGNSVPAALAAFDPTPHVDVLILAASISLFWGFPFLLRAGVAYDRLVLFSVINLNFAILWSCYHYGGITSPTLTWVLIIPILSLFYVGGERRLQPWLLAVTAAAFVLFFLAYLLLPPPPNDMPEAAMLGLGAVSTVATLAYVATMAIYYARVFDAGVDLEIEVRRRRAMADELRNAVARAHRSGSAKSEFLARMSHEIRTPLNAIIGYGQILKEEARETGDRMLGQDVARILDAASYLVRLIDMILDLAKIEAGRMRFDPHPHEIADLLARAVAARRCQFVANRIRVAVEIAPGLARVQVDAHRFLQILDAILENAATHALSGKITLTAARAWRNGREMVVTRVIDTGKGIDPETLPKLFETFATSHAAADGRYGGTGLNLAVCSQLCRAMGGLIEVESTLGQGTSFTITLPLDAPPAHQAPPTPAPQQRISA